MRYETIVQGKFISRPNRDTGPAFAEALQEAQKVGVEIRAMDCIVTPDSMRIDEAVEVRVRGGT